PAGLGGDEGGRHRRAPYRPGRCPVGTSGVRLHYRAPDARRAVVEGVPMRRSPQSNTEVHGRGPRVPRGRRPRVAVALAAGLVLLLVAFAGVESSAGAAVP